MATSRGTRAARGAATVLAVALLAGACGRGTPEQRVSSAPIDLPSTTRPIDSPAGSEDPAAPEPPRPESTATTAPPPLPPTSPAGAPGPSTASTARPAAPGPCGAPVVSEFPVGGATPGSLAAAPDGSVWFTETDQQAVGHLGPDGAVRTILLTGNRHAVGIAVAPDGDIWFTQYSGYQPGAPPADPASGPAAIGHLTPEGSMTEFPLPTQQANPMGVPDMGSSPTAIVAGPDGAMWFTEEGADQIGRITAEGLITEYPLPDRSRRHDNPEGITVGPDGAIWFTEALANQLGRIDPATGSITEFPTYTNAAQSGISQSVAAGSDGAVWFDNINVAVIGHMTTAGKATVVRLPDGRYKPTALAVGPDGSMWFFDQQKPAIVRLSAQGRPADVVTLPGGSNQYVFGTALALDHGGRLWFAEAAAKKIGRIDCGRPRV